MSFATKSASSLRSGANSAIVYLDRAYRLTRSALEQVEVAVDAIATEIEMNDAHLEWGVEQCQNAWDRQMSAATVFVGFIFSISAMIQGDDLDEYDLKSLEVAKQFVEEAIAGDDEITLKSLNAFEERFQFAAPRIADMCNVVPFERPARQLPNFALMNIKELKAWAEENGIDRDAVKEFGSRRSRDTWEEALIALTA